MTNPSPEYPEPTEATICGHSVVIDNLIGHIAVSHDGSITWDKLQEIKNQVWGKDARAIEVYPAERDVINNATIRHLWRLGEKDFAPDLLGHNANTDALEARFNQAWKGL